MRALARRAGLSVTTLYNLFGSKEEILLALIQDGVDSVRPVVEAESASDPLAALQRLAVSPAAYLAQHARVFQPMIAAGLYQSGGRSPQMQAFYGTLIVAIEPLVKAAQDAGYVTEDVSARLIASAIFYAFRGAVEDWGCGLIGHDALARRIQVGVHFVLLAVAADKARKSLQRNVETLQTRAIQDLAVLFPGLGPAPVTRPAAMRKQRRASP
jgi:AcrR family transcriptional regulator